MPNKSPRRKKSSPHSKSASRPRRQSRQRSSRAFRGEFQTEFVELAQSMVDGLGNLIKKHIQEQNANELNEVKKTLEEVQKQIADMQAQIEKWRKEARGESFKETHYATNLLDPSS